MICEQKSDGYAEIPGILHSSPFGKYSSGLSNNFIKGYEF